MPTTKTRERAVLDAVKSTTRQRDFKVQLPWIPPATWNTMLSTNDEVREGYKCLGRAALHLAFAVSFMDACGGLGVGCPVGMFGALENCLLSEEVLFELMKKPCHRNTRLRVASKGVTLVRDAVHIFLGGLWNSDTENLGQILPWSLSSPLVSRPPKRARNATNNQHPVELRGIQRIYALQFAGRPLKISKAQEEQYFELIDSLLTTPPASPYPYLAEEDDELKTDANADDWVNVLQAPSTSSRIYGARIAHEPLTALAAGPPTVGKMSCGAAKAHLPQAPSNSGPVKDRASIPDKTGRAPWSLKNMFSVTLLSDSARLWFWVLLVVDSYRSLGQTFKCFSSQQ
ncbi:hypothetical protein B0H14DRAFT_2588393 [Mycena olivaceomarginata]|nr:hypothetical protein B0H14DRAFT_2588393 [Mycena olivaceomarginata]